MANRPRGQARAGLPAKRVVEKLRKDLEIEVGKGSLMGSFWGNAHDLMKLVYRDPGFPIETRMDAAKVAIKHETPQLAAIEHSGPDKRPMEMITREMTAEEAADAYHRMFKGDD